ncbi:MAG TPA: hypothetical protein VGJ84_02540, partial [Polyangiaceae bacterium]
MMVVKLSRLGLVLCLALPVGALLGCGGGGGAGQDAKHAQLKPGEMPAGGSWTGVYYDKMYGELHLLQDGANGNGAWRTEAGDKWGEMHGKIDGDLFRFEWTERTIGQVGSTAVR